MNRRPTSPGRSSSTPPFDALRDLLRTVKAADAELDDAPPQFRPTTQRAPRPSNILEDWRIGLLSLFDQFPSSFQHLYDTFYRYRFAIHGIYQSGIITASAHSVRAPNDKLEILIDWKSRTHRTRCTCPESGGTEPCEHAYCFLDLVTDLLENSNEDLACRIASRQFTPGKPDLDIFRPGSRGHLLALLDSVPTQVELPDNDVELAARSEDAATQLSWNININNTKLHVEPQLQKAKKRGGFTKGRKMSLDKFFKHKGLSGTDAEIQRLVELQSSGYRATFSLEAFAAIIALIDHPRVSINGSPGSVRQWDGALVFQKDHERCWLAPKHAIPNESQLLRGMDCVIHILEEKGIIEVFHGESQQLDCLASLLRLPRFPLELETELLSKVVEACDLLPIELPADANLTVEENRCPSVMVMRSCADGTLDYGFRVRDSQGKLYQPGSGRVCKIVERDGTRVQLRRNFASEREATRHLAEQVGLPPGKLEGTITDFGEALNFIERVQAAQDSDAEILWDKSSEAPLRMLGSVTSNNVSVGITKKRDWFQLAGSCTVGDQSLDLAEILNSLGSAAGHGEFVKVGDKGWAKISSKLRGQLARLRDGLVQERRSLQFDATSAPAIRELLEQDVQFQSTRAWNKCLARLDSAEALEPVLPEGLQASLREYQLEGYQWLRRLAEWGVGGILADDMGLGKTLQTLAVILDRADQGPTLVIAPTSVGFNWIREANKFTPSLDTHLYRETDRQEFLENVQAGQLVVCSYGLALRDAEALAKVEWSTLVLDEAQAIKNSRSKTSLAIANIQADWKVALTGTPVENHLGELWSLFRVISPGVFGGWEQFRKRFAAPIEKDDDQERRQALRDRLTPFVLRRTKSEVLKDLPPRTETNVHVELTPVERAMYDKVRLSVVSEMDDVTKLDDVKDQRFRILALLTRMRQLACSPKLVDETWTARSSKLVHLCETLKELAEEGHRVLIFSQFVKHLTLIREMLEEEKITYEYLDGSTPAAKRQECVDRFQTGDATAFLISLKAGGTGLNLTAADYVIHMDPWWNPAVEDQATDRAHRMGQDKPVMVYRFIAQNTIEDEILRLHDTKRDLVAGVMDGTHAAAKLSTQDLVNLVKAGSNL